jgi:hypothetical protein
MVIRLLGALSAFLPAVLAAQVTFERTYGGAGEDYGHTVVPAGTGYLLSGYTYSFGSGAADAYLVRTDSLGETLWTRVYGSDADDWSFRAIPTADSGCAVVGHSVIAGSKDVSLLKTAANGDSLWARTYGGGADDIGYAVAQCPDSGFIVVGTTCSFGAGQGDVYLVRTTALGDTLWTRTYGGASEEQGNAVVPTADSGFIVCAWTRSFGAGAGDVYLVKTDACGDTLWTRRYGGTGNDYCHAIRPTLDGGYVMAGVTFSYGAAQGDFYLIRTDANGDTLWTRTYGTAAAYLGHTVDLTADGGFALTGVTRSFGAGAYDAWLIRTDSLGDTLWTRTFGGVGEERAFSVMATADGGFALGGWTASSGAGGADAWLVKTDSAGRAAIAEPTEPPVLTTTRTRPAILPAAVAGTSGPPVLFDVSGRRLGKTTRAGVYFVRLSGASRRVARVIVVK